jgi:hypothetical protein
VDVRSIFAPQSVGKFQRYGFLRELGVVREASWCGSCAIRALRYWSTKPISQEQPHESLGATGSSLERFAAPKCIAQRYSASVIKPVKMKNLTRMLTLLFGVSVTRGSGQVSLTSPRIEIGVFGSAQRTIVPGKRNKLARFSKPSAPIAWR